MSIVLDFIHQYGVLQEAFNSWGSHIV